MQPSDANQWWKELRAKSAGPSEDQLFLVLTLIIGAVVGLTVVAFVAMTEQLGKRLLTASPLECFLSPFIGSLVGGFLLSRFFPGARGSGIPQTRFALLLQRGFIPFRTVAGKFLCSSISLGSGVALGREGPSVQIGAGIASVVGRRIGLSEEKVRSLIPVGTAAAVAAAFNTPLAAVLFTLEEILADMHARVVGSVVLGAATSWIVLRLLLGDEPLFHVPSYQLVHPVEFGIYAVLGVFGGLISAAFVKLLLWVRMWFLRVPSWAVPLAPAAGGLFVGIVAIWVPGVLGVGYHLVSEALDSQLALKMMFVLLILKFAATVMCYGSGNAGGIFGPSLFIGAMLGGVVGQGAHTLLPDYTASAGAYALVGMGAAFAGIVRTPMTSVIMIFEVTRDYSIIVPLMIANLCSFLISRRFQPVPIYQALQKQEGIEMPSEEDRTEPLLVEQAMRQTSGEQHALVGMPPGAAVHPDDPLDVALRRLGTSGREELPVLSRVGMRQIGVIGRQDALGAYGLVKNGGHKEAGKQAMRKDFLPALAGSALFVILLVSGIAYWQRSHRQAGAQEEYEQGVQLLERGQPGDAGIRFRTALSTSPTNAQYRTALGLALVESGHPGEAIEHLERARKNQPSSPAVLLGLARANTALGNKGPAESYFRRALAAEWPAGEMASRKHARLEYGKLLQSEGKGREAVMNLRTYLDEFPTDREGGLAAARMMEDLGGAVQAEEPLELLAKRYPQDGEVWIELGRSRLSSGKPTEAMEAFRAARLLEPNRTDVATGLAQAETMVRLNPSARGVRYDERKARTVELAKRMLIARGSCMEAGDKAALEKLAATRFTSNEAIEAGWAELAKLWKRGGTGCTPDAALDWIAAQLGG
ncbi:MAG: chloride channel protein [Acidobacteriota bacterium]